VFARVFRHGDVEDALAVEVPGLGVGHGPRVKTIWVFAIQFLLYRVACGSQHGLG